MIKLIFLLLLLGIAGAAKSVQVESAKLKAAYVLNFARFVYWPDDIINPTDNFSICVFGYNKSDDSFNLLLDKVIENKKVKIKYLEKYNKNKHCYVVFISKNIKNNYINIIKEINFDTVLTVSDIAGFSQKYGMIELVTINNKIRFEINVKRSVKSNIKYRSQLLEVAAGLR